jgi:hypothetical protein
MKIPRTRAVLGGLAVLAAVAARAQSAPLRWASGSAVATGPAAATARPAPSGGMPTADSDAWSAVLENIKDDGVFTAGDETYPAHFSIEDVKGSTAAAHSEDYATVFGGIGEDDGLFHPGWADIVSEKWAVDAKGGWRIEQWLFSVKMDGTVRLGMHNILHETLDRHVLGEEELGIEKGGAAAFAGLVARWAAYKGPSAE